MERADLYVQRAWEMNERYRRMIKEEDLSTLEIQNDE